MYVYMHICIYTPACRQMYIYICIYTYVYVHIGIHIYIYRYTHTYIHTWNHLLKQIAYMHCQISEGKGACLHTCLRADRYADGRNEGRKYGWMHVHLQQRSNTDTQTHRHVNSHAHTPTHMPCLSLQCKQDAELKGYHPCEVAKGAGGIFGQWGKGPAGGLQWNLWGLMSMSRGMQV